MGKNVFCFNRNMCVFMYSADGDHLGLGKSIYRYIRRNIKLLIADNLFNKKFKNATNLYTYKSGYMFKPEKLKRNSFIQFYPWDATVEVKSPSGAIFNAAKDLGKNFYLIYFYRNQDDFLVLMDEIRYQRSAHGLDLDDNHIISIDINEFNYVPTKKDLFNLSGRILGRLGKE